MPKRGNTERIEANRAILLARPLRKPTKLTVKTVYDPSEKPHPVNRLAHVHLPGRTARSGSIFYRPNGP